MFQYPENHSAFRRALFNVKGSLSHALQLQTNISTSNLPNLYYCSSYPFKLNDRVTRKTIYEISISIESIATNVRKKLEIKLNVTNVSVPNNINQEIDSYQFPNYRAVHEITLGSNKTTRSVPSRFDPRRDGELRFENPRPRDDEILVAGCTASGRFDQERQKKC